MTAYTYISWDNFKMLFLATIPNMMNRTLSISSASKVFPATGYRIGWVYSFNASLVNSLKYIHTYIINGPPTPNQVKDDNIFSFIKTLIRCLFYVRKLWH